ncbi:hypothetical protein [Streptomyces sp. NPDC001315]
MVLRTGRTDAHEDVIPDGLSLLRIGRDAGEGVRQEPDVWMRHA